MREGEVVCCAEGMTRGACGNWAAKNAEACAAEMFFAGWRVQGGVDWDDKSEPINLPLGYTRGTYKAELARRARIYANWGKTT